MKVIIKTRAGNKFKGMFVIMIFINRQNMQLKLGKIKTNLNLYVIMYTNNSCNKLHTSEYIICQKIYVISKTTDPRGNKIFSYQHK